ncbi:MAG: lyase family protein [Nocardioides sp.]|uniref:lyase family protein n=1 Tax=Nocardioides sp. TaxID=35761 RepID=UPI0039E2F9EC
MADLFWPGEERAGALMGDAALLDAMVAVEQAWLDALTTLTTPPNGASVPPNGASGSAEWGLARTQLGGLVGEADLEALATGAEGGGNPVLGLVTLLRERSGNAWVHRGLTSQDVVDTALILVAREAADAVRRELDAQVEALASLAEAHRDTVMAGRTLGQHAVPITFGLKAAGWLTGLLDARDALAALRWPVQLGGAAGTLAAATVLTRDPDRSDADDAWDLVRRTAATLGLEARPPWHTSRRPITAIGDALVTATDAWGRVAADVITLSRTEIGELAEPAGEGRGGSSTMPHKRNPVLSVLLRRAAITAPPLASTLHLAAALSDDERPSGGWHAEWATLRDLGRRTVVAARQATELLAGLEVNAARMAATVEAGRDDLLAEQESVVAFAGAGTRPQAGAEAEVDGDYLGATGHLIDEVLERVAATTAGERATSDPDSTGSPAVTERSR